MNEQINDTVKKSAYFSNRNVDEKSYIDYILPRYLNPYFTETDKEKIF